jgi:hypothetical protein
MTAHDIREAADAQPFRPFKLRLAGGPAIKVAHPDFIAVHPKGRTVIVFGNDESYRIVDVMMVSEIEFSHTARKSVAR